MPVVPQPCTPSGGDGGWGDGGCCAPSIATAPWCTPTGVVLVVVSAPCVACDSGSDAAVPEVAGWIEPATGELTPGPPPEGAPCEAGAPGAACATVETLTRCDVTPDGCVQFLRRLVLDCDGQVTATVDTAPDGVTPYTPAGEVSDCADCTPSAGGPGACARLVGLSGPDVWEMPPGTESVGLSVVCGPIVVTDCAGEVTRINECGLSLDWAAAGGPDGPGVLCTPMTVQALDGAAVYIRYLAPCPGGDNS